MSLEYKFHNRKLNQVNQMKETTDGACKLLRV